MKKYIFLKESNFVPNLEQNFYGTLSESLGCTLSHFTRTNSVVKIGKVLQNGQVEHRVVQSYKDLTTADVYNTVDFNQLPNHIDEYGYVFVGVESDASEVFSDTRLIQSLKLLTYKDGCLYDITNQCSIPDKTHIVSIMCATKMNTTNAYVVIFDSMLSFDHVENDIEPIDENTILIHSDSSNTLRSKILDIVLSGVKVSLGHNKVFTSPQILLIDGKQSKVSIDVFGPASIFHNDTDAISGFNVCVESTCLHTIDSIGKVTLHIQNGGIGYVKIRVQGNLLFSQTTDDNIHETLTTEFLIIQ